MNEAPRRAGVSVGSNVRPDLHIPAGLAALRTSFARLEMSRVYRSPPTGGRGAPLWNLAVTFETVLDWRALRAALKRIEDDESRERNVAGPVHVTLDLDLVILGACRVDTDEFALPAADLPTRAHVLGPLAEIWPEWAHPGDGWTLARRWRDFDRANVTLEPVALPCPA